MEREPEVAGSCPSLYGRTTRPSYGDRNVILRNSSGSVQSCSSFAGLLGSGLGSQSLPCRESAHWKNGACAELREVCCSGWLLRLHSLVRAATALGGKMDSPEGTETTAGTKEAVMQSKSDRPSKLWSKLSFISVITISTPSYCCKKLLTKGV